MLVLAKCPTEIDALVTVRRKATPRARVDRQSSLKAQIKEGALKRARRDAGLAEEWFILEEKV